MENSIFDSSLSRANISKDKFHSICRICLISIEYTIPLTEPELIQIIILIACVQEKVQEKLPQQVCSSCYNNLKSFHRFSELCRRATEILTNIISENECKTEPVDNNISEETILYKNELDNHEETESIDEITSPNDEYDDTINYPDNYNEYDLMLETNKENTNVQIQNENESLAQLQTLTDQINSNSEQITATNSNIQSEINLLYALTNVAKEQYVTDKNIQCDVCHATFQFKSELDGHKLKHTKERAYVCVICGRAYKRAYGLDLHIKSVHTKTQPQTICHICGEFVFTHLLHSHIRTHQPRVQVSKTCEICLIDFVTRRSMESHMREQHSM